MTQLDANIFSMMQSGNPYASYRKTILGKILVRVLNPWTNQVEEVIVVGNPKKDLESCTIDTWSEIGDTYFKKANRKHFDVGNLIKFTKATAVIEANPNDVTDDELETLLNSRYLKFTAGMDKFTSTAPLYRLLDLAHELEKSEKIIKAIEARIAELDSLGTS